MILSQGDGGQQGRDEVEAVVRAQTQVDEGEVEGPARGLGQGVLEVADGDDLVALRLESRPTASCGC